ncbi:MAG: hypothetical protein E7524_07610 [Ruminococcaceae bacterium]|nr:hypothetical protein [Oscillospiraceae bacterium]
MKKIGNWLKNHFIISCIVSGFIGAIIAWGLNWILISPPVKVGNLPQKELTCTLNYSQKLITKNTKDDGFKIMYHDKEVMDPYIFSITISNTGDYAIENEDFKKEFSIDFTGSEGIIKASVIEARNKEIWDEILENSSINGSELVFSDFFLNPGESFTLSIITNKNPSGIKYNSRIEGVPNLTLVNTRADRIEELRNNRTIFIAIMISVVSMVTVGIVIFLIVDAKRYKKYKKELLSQLTSKSSDCNGDCDNCPCSQEE